MTLLLEERVTNLEQLMAELVRAQTRTQRQLDQLSREMVDFKREMVDFKREMVDFKREMVDFKDEMLDFKREMVEFREESKRERREFRQSLAEISHKMGTLAEDMVAPSIPRILREIVNCAEPPSMRGVRLHKHLRDGRAKEYDVVATCGDYLLINETKSRLRPEDIPNYIETLKLVRTFLPEYADKQIIGALASFYVDPSLVTYGERQGIIMLGVIDGLMQMLNTPDFKLQTL